MNCPKMKIDLHVHTKFGGDTDAEPEEAVIRAIEANLSGIAFTEHYYYEASDYVESMREKYGGSILIFRGVEFSSGDGHCLVFGLNTDKMSLKRAAMEEVIRAVHLEGGVVIPSHPYRGMNSIGERIRNLKGLCALEGYNGSNLHNFNVKAIDAAHHLGIPFTGGSDAHQASEVGSCFTEFDDKVTLNNLTYLLKKGKYRGVDTRKISRYIFT